MNLFAKIMVVGGVSLLMATPVGAKENPEVTWDSHSLMFDGRRICPVMGEVHYSRLPANEWQQEVRKMKEGGVTIIATYVFWNHIEEQEGIFRWDGQRNLRRFLDICREEKMPVVLRLGPFCHGEVRNGGIPDWVFAKGCKLRERNSVFLGLVEKCFIIINDLSLVIFIFINEATCNIEALSSGIGHDVDNFSALLESNVWCVEES